MAFRGLTEGKDVDGIPRRLGDRDSMGHIVGFIDEDGNCWETVAERDGAITAGRYQDAMIEWESKGGEKPDPTVIAIETCFDRGNVTAAADEAQKGWEFILRYRPIARKQMVEEIVERFYGLESPSIDELRAVLDEWPRRVRRDDG